MVGNAPLKIFHVLFSRGFAGSERSTAESCNQQVNEHQVILVIRKGHRRRGRSIVDSLDRRVRVIELSSRFFTGFYLRKLIVSECPDVIHCHLRRATRVVAKIAARQPLPAVTVSTLHIGVNGAHFLAMDGLICNARWQVDSIPREYQGQAFKANNSLVPHRRIDSQEREQLRAELGLRDNDILWAGVGRFHASKAWDTLIAAFKNAQLPDNVRLFLFGSGSLEGELKAQAQECEQIVFAGFRDDIKDLYQAFDLLVCPSRFEPLPRVMLEAMDAGTPVLASDAGGCKELIDDYGGYLFATDNIVGLSEQLELLAQLRPERLRPDLSAHSIENANAAMVGFYRELMAIKLGALAQ